jgi:hypothetical protein
MECLPLWPTYIGERRGGLWAKHMGLKWGAIGNTFGEHIGNLGNILKTHWELEGNMLGTKEKGKKLSPPTQNLKIKKSRHFECMHAETSHCLHRISLLSICPLLVIEFIKQTIVECITPHFDPKKYKVFSYDNLEIFTLKIYFIFRIHY